MMKPRHAVALAMSGMAGVATPALAQNAPRIDDSDVIVVTAQRRSEALEQVPMTVSVLTNDTLAAAGVVSLRDLSTVTTGFQLGQGGAFPQPAIRGVTTLLNGTFENNVAVYVDGFYQVAPQAINIDLPNIESVQVLKGPQGTLYGRNATGGAILLNTRGPGSDWEGKAELTYARFDDKRASGYIAGPINDWLGISLAGYIRRSDGYFKLASRTVPGEYDGNAAPLEQDAVRAKLRLQPTDNLTATLAYNYTHISDPRGNMFTPLENVAQFYALSPGGSTLPTRLGTAAWDYAARIESIQHETNLILELDTAIGTVKSYTGHGWFKPVTSLDFDGSYVNTGWYTSAFDQKTFQQAVDFAVNAIDNVDLIVGGLYFRDDLKTKPPFGASYGVVRPAPPPTSPPPFSSLVLNQATFIGQKKEAWAVYADLTYRLFSALVLNLGGRYSSEAQEMRSSVTSGTGAVIVPLSFADAQFRKFTPRASLRYEIGPRTNIYASYSQGFRSGAFPSTIPGNRIENWVPAKQESVNAYEAGFKTAGSGYRFEIAGFYYDYKDLQLSTTILDPTCSNPGEPQPCTRLLSLIQNAPAAKIKGIEGSFEIEPLENLTVRGGALWLHARFGEGTLFTGVGVNPAVPGINANDDPLKVAVNVTQVAQDISGLQLARAPDFSANLGVDYRVPMGEGGLRFSLNGKYTDSYVVTNPSIWGNAPGVPADRQREQRFREGGFVLLNASLTWTDPNDAYFVRLWGNNITDHRYRLHYTGTANFGTYAPMAEPATYGVTLGYKFP